MSQVPYTATLPVTRAWPTQVLLVLAGSLVLAASARISTPFVPVPTTLQTYALLALAAYFGPRVATAMTLTYLVEGLAGFPVFAGGAAGPLVLLGTTAGYLFAFPVAAAFVGRCHAAIAQRFGIVGSIAVMLVAHCLIIAGGVAWLTPRMGFAAAFTIGAAPFVVGSLVKSVLAAVSIRLVRR